MNKEIKEINEQIEELKKQKEEILEKEREKERAERAKKKEEKAKDFEEVQRVVREFNGKYDEKVCLSVERYSDMGNKIFSRFFPWVDW